MARPVPRGPSASPLRYGRAPHARTRTRMASKSPKVTSPPTGPGHPRLLPGLRRHCRTRTGALPQGCQGICQLWTCRSTTLAGTGYLSAQQPREPHLTTTLELVASMADRLVSVQRSHCLGARAVGTSSQRCLHVNGTATPTAVLRRIHWVRLPTAAHLTHTAPAHVLCADPTSKDLPHVTGRARRRKF